MLSLIGNVFSFVPGVSLDYHTADTPLLATPLIKRGNRIEIDMRAMGGQLLVVNIDGSVQIYQASEADSLIDPETGKTIFQNGKLFGTNAQGLPAAYDVVTPDY